MCRQHLGNKQGSGRGCHHPGNQGREQQRPVTAEAVEVRRLTPADGELRSKWEAAGKKYH